jgi:phospholipid transport system substrate-binding protein
MRNSILAGSLALGLFAATLPAAHAEAADPAVQQVQTFYDALLDTMKHARELGIKGRYERLKPVIERTFDLPGMTRLSVGPSWNNMTPQEQQALTAAVERMTIANYASNFNGYDGERFVVDPTANVRGARRVVMSKLITGSDTISFNYSMRETGGTWKILDIYLMGFVSQMAKQRSDFSATVQAGGAPALEKKINALSDKLMRD